MVQVIDIYLGLVAATGNYVWKVCVNNHRKYLEGFEAFPFFIFTLKERSIRKLQINDFTC
jgi:hypothetical protein